MSVEERLRRVASSPFDSRSIVTMAQILSGLVTELDSVKARVRKLEAQIRGGKPRSRRK